MRVQSQSLQVRHQTMNRILKLVLMVAGTATAASAQTLKGTVIDAYSQTPLKDVTVADANNTSTSSVTDATGQFSISCTANMTVLVRRLGYESFRGVVKNCDEALQ